MSSIPAKANPGPQVAKIKLSAGLTSASLLFFVLGGILARLANAEYDDYGYYNGYDDSHDSSRPYRAAEITCLVFAALFFIAAVISWTITYK